LGRIRLLGLQVAQVVQGHRTIEVDASAGASPPVLDGDGPRPIALEQVGGHREARLVEPGERRVPVAGKVPEIGATQVDVVALDVTTGAARVTDLEAHVPRPASAGAGPVVGDAEAEQLGIEIEVERPGLGCPEIVVVDDVGVTGIVRNGVTTPGRRGRGQNLGEIGPDDQLGGGVDADGKAVALADNLIVNQIDELGLGVSVGGIAESEILDDEFARVIGRRSKGPLVAAPLDADARRDAETGLELTDVHLHHVGCLVQDHLGDQLIGPTARLGQILPADHKTAARRFSKGRRADFPTRIADVGVRRHDGIGGQVAAAQGLVRVIVTTTQTDIERDEPFAADLDLEEIRVEETEAEGQPDAVGVSVRRRALHRTRSDLERRSVGNGIHFIPRGFRRSLEIGHHPHAAVLAPCREALRAGQESTIGLTEYLGHGRGQDQKQGEKGLECQALTVLATHAEK